MYIVTLPSTDTLTRGSQALRTSIDDTWMSTVQLLVVVISRDNPWMYIVIHGYFDKGVPGTADIHG